MPADDLPAHVVSGQPIESAWGNAVVDALSWARVDSGYVYVAPHVQLSTGSIVHVPGPTVLPYDTVMFVIAACSVGSDSSAIASVTFACLTNIVGANSQPTPSSVSPGASQYVNTTLIHSYNVPAGANAEFALHANWAAGYTGTPYTSAMIQWDRYRK